jgi:hypothetical protein
MPWFLVTGHVTRTTLRETWIEIEAPDQQAAIEQAQEEDAQGELEWRDDKLCHEDTDKSWSAQEFTPTTEESR